MYLSAGRGRMSNIVPKKHLNVVWWSIGRLLGLTYIYLTDKVAQNQWSAIRREVIENT